MSAINGSNGARYRVPRFPGAVIVPKKLQTALATGGRVHVLRAARGFGKSTIGAWWATRRARSIPVWLGICRGERPGTLARRLSTALAESGVRPGGNSESGNGRSNRRVMLVIDQSERVDGHELAIALTEILRNYPEVFVLVLMRLTGPAEALRDLPHFGAEITTQTLRFSPHEVAELAQSMSIRISHAQAQEIAEQTQGWPAMIAAVLTGMLYGKEPDWNAGTYFFDEIFNDTYTQDEKIRDLALSVSDPVTEEMATFILGDGYEPGYLARFGEDGDCPLLPRAVQGEEYRSSPFMRAAATKILFVDSPETHRCVHARLSEWHLTAGQRRQALWHGVMSRHPAAVEAAVRAHWGSYLLTCPDLLQIALEQVPRPETDEDGLWRFLADLEPRSAALRSARILLTSTFLNEIDTANLEETGPVAKHFNQWGWVQVFYGMPSTALFAFWRAHAACAPGGRTSSEARIGIALCLALLGYTEQSRGWLDSVPVGGPSETRFATAVMGLVTTILAEDARPILPPDAVGSNPDTARRALMNFFSQLLQRVNLPGGDPLVRSFKKAWLERDPLYVPHPPYAPLDVWERSTLRELGFALPARVPVDQHRPVAADATDAWVWAQAGLARQYVLDGEYARVLELSSRAPKEVRLLPRPWLSILLSRTIASHRLGQRGLASEALHQAVTLADECAVFSPFLLMASHELREVAQEVPQLLAMVNKQLITEGKPNTLTPNQLVLLRELASGVQLKIIAQRLYLSTSTVKTHLSHIYRELGVSNRREAVSRAQDLRLLVRNR